MQNAPWKDQNRKKIMKRWWVFQNRSWFALRGPSKDVSAIATKATSIMYPVHPGPVVKLSWRKPLIPRPSEPAMRAKLTQCAMVCSSEKNTIDHAVTMPVS